MEGPDPERPAVRCRNCGGRAELERPWGFKHEGGWVACANATPEFPHKDAIIRVGWVGLLIEELVWFRVRFWKTRG